MNVECPGCGRQIEVEFYENGECTCGKYYYWDEFCNSDYSECWDEIYWEDEC